MVNLSNPKFRYRFKLRLRLRFFKQLKPVSSCLILIGILYFGNRLNVIVILHVCVRYHCVYRIDIIYHIYDIYYTYIVYKYKGYYSLCPNAPDPHLVNKILAYKLLVNTKRIRNVFFYSSTNSSSTFLGYVQLWTRCWFKNFYNDQDNKGNRKKIYIHIIDNI